jgi:mRNA interferase MazF
MKRGDIVSVAAPGDYGKPRPAVVIQADALTQGGLGSVIICLITSHLFEAPAFRIPVPPEDRTGLKAPSQIMVDKLLTVPLARIGSVMGCLDDEALLRLNRTLAFVVGLGQ